VRKKSFTGPYLRQQRQFLIAPFLQFIVCSGPGPLTDTVVEVKLF